MPNNRWRSLGWKNRVKHELRLLENLKENESLMEHLFDVNIKAIIAGADAMLEGIVEMVKEELKNDEIIKRRGGTNIHVTYEYEFVSDYMSALEWVIKKIGGER